MSRQKRASLAIEKVASNVDVAAPLSAQTNTVFTMVLQGPQTNLLGRTKVKEYNTKIDNVTGKATITEEGLTIILEECDHKLDMLKFITHRLFDSLMIKFTESGRKSTLITVSIEEYMTLCGLKDKKEAVKQVSKSLQVLRGMYISYKSKTKKSLSHGEINISQGWNITNGIIYFVLTEPFYKELLRFSVMPFLTKILSYNFRDNPNSYYFYKRIAQHKYMNSGKPNEDIISVKTLLNSTPELPRYEDDVNHAEQRIIKPFERDMDALKDVLKWEYCNSGGTLLTEKQLNNLTKYRTVSDLLVKITWLNYPDQAPRLQRKEDFKQLALEKSKNKRAKASPSK